MPLGVFRERAAPGGVLVGGGRKEKGDTIMHTCIWGLCGGTRGSGGR